MRLTPEEWHLRYIEQARWTDHLRRYLFEKSHFAEARFILDVGCGTGALELDLISNDQNLPTGLDIDRAALTIARLNVPHLPVVEGTALKLPFANNSFEICFCHFLLLWTDPPGLVVAEMVRVTKAGGVVIAVAEPDYGGRIDYPEELNLIGYWQERALKIQGADPRAGRKLNELFYQAGLIDIETGVMGGLWTRESSTFDFESEWKVIESDLAMLNLSTAETRLIQKLKMQDADARASCKRILYVPTFYAWGRVPG